MKPIRTLALAAALALPSAPALAQDVSFEQASRSVEERLEGAVEELNALREAIMQEKLPLGRQLSELETELSAVRLEYQQTTRLLDSRTLDLSNLRTEIEARKDEVAYLSNLFAPYITNLQARLHITELQRYEGALDLARLAPENESLTESEVFDRQVGLISLSVDRLLEALGGTSFEGQAVDRSSLLNPGTFVLVGPVAIFQPEAGGDATVIEQRLGSLEPAALPYGKPEDAAAAGTLIARGEGLLPLDPTLGNALKIEATKETFLEHVQKGGAVMIPIFALAGLALLFALYKWLSMAFVGTPSEKRVASLLDAVGERDRESVQRHVAMIQGPVGEMLTRGVDHMDEPRELVEEVMYEKVLTTRLKLNSFLPFIAIAAASAPLLGLLGTVTGIINTFKMITVFGSGDVKSLSGGISEALITTKFGLIVAIPALLLHAFLSRKARRIQDQMEKTAVAFTNELGRAQNAAADERAREAAAVDPAAAAAGVPATPPASETVEQRIERLAAEQQRAAAVLQASTAELAGLREELAGQGS